MDEFTPLLSSAPQPLDFRPGHTLTEKEFEAKAFDVSGDTNLHVEGVIRKPNVEKSADPIQDIKEIIARNTPPLSWGTQCGKYVCTALCCATGVGCCFVYCNSAYVKKTELRFCLDADGYSRLMEPGFHMVAPMGSRVETCNLNDAKICSGNVSVIRVKQGELGLAIEGGLYPVLLEEGLHVYESPNFSFVKFVDRTAEHTTHGSVHVMFIRQGFIAKVLINGNGHLLKHKGNGLHVLNCGQFEYLGVSHQTDEHINAGTLHRIIVPASRVGLALENKTPRMLESGHPYYIDNAGFQYLKSVDYRETTIYNDSLKIITVKDGVAGLTYDEGKLIVLKTGRHVITNPKEIPAGFISLSQRTLPIQKVVSMSSDNVGIIFDAGVTIQVRDPFKAVTELSMSSAETMSFNPKFMDENIVEKAKLSLSIIIGNNKFNDSFRATTGIKEQSNSMTNDGSNGGAPPPFNPQAVQSNAGSTSSGSFKQHVHDLFMQAFAESMLQDSGVEVLDMSIEDIQLTDPNLQKAMSAAAVKHNELESAEVNVLVAEKNADAQKRSEIIEAQGHAAAVEILAQAEAKRIEVLDAAMSKINPVTQQRELIRASGDAISGAKATLVFAESTMNVSNILGGNTPISQEMQRGAFGNDSHRNHPGSDHENDYDSA